MSIQAVAWALEQDVPDSAAKLVLISLANALNGKTGKCFPSFEQIMKESSNSRSTVIRKLKWLAANGWIMINSEYAHDGRQMANSYTLKIEGVRMTRGGVKLTPEGVTYDTGEGVTHDTPNIEPEEIPEGSFSKAKAFSKQSARVQQQAFEQEFHEIFWPAYPHKVGKPRALKSFLKARKNDGLENIMAGLERYVTGKPPDRQWLNPETFLNGERWNDQPAATSEQNHARTNIDNRSTARQFAEAVFDKCRREGVDPFKPIIGGNVSTEVPRWGETNSGTDSQNPLDDERGARPALVASNAR